MDPLYKTMSTDKIKGIKNEEWHLRFTRFLIRTFYCCKKLLLSRYFPCKWDPQDDEGLAQEQGDGFLWIFGCWGSGTKRKWIVGENGKSSNLWVRYSSLQGITIVKR